jgi:transcriptional regulator with XRE-family HTH domain
MDMDVFAKRLKETREQKNISAKELAEALGINKATIHHYERADFKSIKTPILRDIANYLDVNPDYLIGDTDVKRTVKETEDLLSTITDGEKLLLDLFRQVPEESQQMVLDMVRVALKKQ